MQILLITTIPNRICEYLQCLECAKVDTVDCSTYATKRDKKKDLAIKKDDVMAAIRNILKNDNTDIIITYRCPFLLPFEIYSRAKKGAYNVHPSLLPKYPGLNPWYDIFRNHEREGGVTLHQITRHIDAGRIISQLSFAIDESDTVDSARNKADIEAAKLLESFICKIKRGL